jgi:hypothetical protein
VKTRGAPAIKTNMERGGKGRREFKEGKVTTWNYVLRK